MVFSIGHVINQLAKSFIFKDIRFRIIKIVDIGYIAVIYVIVSMLFARAFEGVFVFDPNIESSKTMHVRTFELLGMLWVYSVIIYISRNLIEKIPSPLNGLYGFDHKRVKELTNATIFVFIFMVLQPSYKNKIEKYYEDYIKSDIKHV
jgi:hypothetical protein